MIIRKATSEDLNAVCSIYNYAIVNTAATFDTEEKSPEYFMEFINNSEFFHYLCVAIDNGIVTGFAGLYPFSRRKAYAGLSELTCYVNPEYHGQSLGTEMCRHVNDYAEHSGLNTVLALFNSNNTPMRKICEHLGYTPRGEMVEVAFKQGQYQSLKIYQKHFRRK
ncbi:N-acetyltransferase [Dickeya oryzae]|uniref:N-acetyltransferase n=1 Tax=Dickeya oryzae TaxID=1240404 RepID=A0AB39IWU0_9GAMM|nr:GNAT family N-acetyltransferase [Dickeya oryzae]MBP2857289.1 N-acetyltransferase [Dickeya oryzae]MCA6989324.1 N-acetyltransferase family protein [Dickeya oryzae]